MSRQPLIAALLILGWVILTWVQRTGQWPSDLMALYMAGHFVAQGTPDLIYDAPTHFFGREQAATWQAALVTLGAQGEQVFPFVYPPLWAYLMAPVSTLFTPTQFIAVAQVAQIGGLALCPVLSWRIVRPDKVSLPVWVVLSLTLLTLAMPVQVALDYGNPQIVATILVIWAVERWSNGAPRQAGAILALATAFKLLPAVFIVLFLIDRNTRAIAAYVCAAAALAGLSQFVVGTAPHLTFLDRIAQLDALACLAEINLSLTSIIVGVLGENIGAKHLASSAHSEIWSVPGAFSIAMKALLLTALVHVVLIAQRIPLRQAAVIAPVMVCIASGLTAPLGWIHYFIPVVVMLPALTVFLPLRYAVAAAGVFIVAQSGPVLVALANLSYETDHMAQFSAATMLLAYGGLASLAKTAGQLSRQTPLRRAGHTL